MRYYCNHWDKSDGLQYIGRNRSKEWLDSGKILNWQDELDFREREINNKYKILDFNHRKNCITIYREGWRAGKVGW